MLHSKAILSSRRKIPKSFQIPFPRSYYHTNSSKMGDFIDAHSRDKKPLNLLRGWPHPSLLPTPAIASAAQTVLSDPAISIPGLLYGPDPGYQPLREGIARWLSGFYGGQADAERICVTGGASQNLACVLQVFSDPLFTRVWMVAPSYFLACRIFDDAGLVTGAVGEGDEGVDLEGLEARLRDAERDEGIRVCEAFLLFHVLLLSACNGERLLLGMSFPRDTAPPEVPIDRDQSHLTALLVSEVYSSCNDFARFC